ncbi:MAG TPA: glycosyltransferase [Armatimonadaceae bacterium]|nr:glycosyltransferase [Armatimonadaceae bacterium]
MKELKAWWGEIGGANGPWLVVGKGPTFERRHEFDLSPYRTVALNHVIREFPADVASAIDIDVVRDCADAIERNAKFLLMPRYPHVQPTPGAARQYAHAGEKRIDAYFGDAPVLKRLSDAGRLVVYDLASHKGPAEAEPQIPFGAFSGDVVVTILAMLGAKKVRLLGVDGGASYAPSFSDLSDKTLLSNGLASFDAQSRGIGRAIWKHDLDCGPLVSEIPMRLYIGTDVSQLVGARVLEYTVRRASSITAQFDTMLHVKAPMPKEKKNQPRTEFSFNRFAIPKLAGYKGRAVYVDADMQVFKDFRGLWDTDFDGATLLHCATSDPKRPKQFAVMLMDCARLDWDLDTIVRGLDEGKYDYDALMKEFCIVPPEQVRDSLSPHWNSLEEYHPGETCLIHYTDMPTQPWVSRRNKNGHLWVEALRDALRDGYVTEDEVKKAVKDGFIRPSLLGQLRVGRDAWPFFNRTLGAVMDIGYKPHRALFKRLKGR